MLLSLLWLFWYFFFNEVGYMLEFQQEFVVIVKVLRIKLFEVLLWIVSFIFVVEEVGKIQQNLMIIGEVNFFIQEVVSNFMSKGRIQFWVGRDLDIYVEF